MTTKTLDMPQKSVYTQKTCSHHWVIESPKGPVSKGICKMCGAEKDFQNYILA